MPASTRVQAMVPDGALVLDNAHGTAPGLALHVSPNPFRADGKPSWLVMLPGPPRELRPMFTNQVAPLLKEKLPLDADFVCRTLRTVGIGESYLEERIAGPLKPLTDAGLELGYCAHSGAVDVRFVARGCGADADVAEAARIVHSLAGEHIFGEGDDELEQVLVRRLTERKQTLALAESCTGGFIANRITNVPGASAVLLAGLVTYSNAAKQSFLGVKAETLAAHGAVSEAVAREMAEGCRARIGADFGIGVTGIAGPGGGTQEKPVGTVFIALASAAGTKVINPVNRYDRETFKHLTCLQALELLRRALPASP
jgi:nicotinamide-nucleotide amidase